MFFYILQTHNDGQLPTLVVCFPLHWFFLLLHSPLAFSLPKLPCLVIVSHPNTCPDNKNKGPDIVDLCLQRHKSTEDRQVTEESCLKGFCNIAKAEEHNKENVKTLMVPKIVTAGSNTVASCGQG